MRGREINSISRLSLCLSRPMLSNCDPNIKNATHSCCFTTTKMHLQPPYPPHQQTMHNTTSFLLSSTTTSSVRVWRITITFFDIYTVLLSVTNFNFDNLSTVYDSLPYDNWCIAKHSFPSCIINCTDNGSHGFIVSWSEIKSGRQTTEIDQMRETKIKGRKEGRNKQKDTI